MPKKDQSSLNHCQTSDAFFPQEEAFSESAMHRRILKVCFLNTIQRRHRRERCGVFFVCFFQRFLPMTDRLTDWPSDRLWLLGEGVLFIYKPGGDFHLKKTFSLCTFEILSCRMVNRIGTMAFQRSFWSEKWRTFRSEAVFSGPRSVFGSLPPTKRDIDMTSWTITRFFD